MYTIGYDIGSSSVKVALVDSATGKAVAVVNEPETEMGMISEQPGWAEQHPEDWWTHVCNGTKRIITNHSIDPKDIKGIGISYQMHGLVVVDADGVPLRPSIIWCDSRAVEIGNKAFEEIGADQCATHLLNSPANFTASKLKWVRENEPHIYAKIAKFMLPGDYIAMKLTGTINTTITGLSEGIFWNFKENETADWLMEHFGFSLNLLPTIVPNFTAQSRVSGQGANESGLAVGTPIMYRAGDQPNNALSLNVFEPGEVAATGGTSGVFYAVTDSLSVAEYDKVNNFAHVNHTSERPRIGKLLCINGAGIMYRWLLNNLSVASYQEMNDLAQSVPVGSDGLLVHPFGNGAERMFQNRDLGTQISGLNLNRHTKAHLCRAALEGIAFSFVYGYEILLSDGIAPKAIRAGNDNLFRADIFADTVATLIDQEIEIYNTTGAIGAARACQIKNGDFANFGHQVMANDLERRIQPGTEKKALQNAYSQWKKQLQQQLKNF